MILFVGDKPSPMMKPDAEPFQGAACLPRLMEWVKEIGVHPYYFINSSDPNCLNLVLMFDLLGAPVVALGNNASKALWNKKRYVPHFKMPHPSGRNRQLNDKTFVAKKLLECKKYITEKAKV